MSHAFELSEKFHLPGCLQQIITFSIVHCQDTSKNAYPVTATASISVRRVTSNADKTTESTAQSFYDRDRFISHKLSLANLECLCQSLALDACNWSKIPQALKIRGPQMNMNKQNSNLTTSVSQKIPSQVCKGESYNDVYQFFITSCAQGSMMRLYVPGQMPKSLCPNTHAQLSVSETL